MQDNRGWVPQNVTKFLICQVGIDTELGGGSPNILSNPKGHVGINTNFGGGGVHSAQKVKSRVFGLWVGIINVDLPLLLFSFFILTCWAIPDF